MPARESVERQRKARTHTHVSLSAQMHLHLTPAYRIQLSCSHLPLPTSTSNYRCALHIYMHTHCCIAQGKSERHAFAYLQLTGKEYVASRLLPQQEPSFERKSLRSSFCNVCVFANKKRVFTHTIRLFKIRPGSFSTDSFPGRICTLRSASQHLKCLSLSLFLAHLSLPRSPATHRPLHPPLHPRHASGRFFSFLSCRRLLSSFGRWSPIRCRSPLRCCCQLLRFSILFDLACSA